MSRRELTDLEARQFATELAGGLAGVVANLGLSDAIKKATCVHFLTLEHLVNIVLKYVIL